MQVIIYQTPKNAMQSGKAKAGQWVLEVESSSSQHADPLMGWVGGASTASQVKLKFSSKDEALEYASRHYTKCPVVVRQLPDRYSPPVQSYSANFAYTRQGKPWTH